MWDFIKQMTDPESIIRYGGLSLLLFVIFAETGLLIGFFLPGDNLILLAGILCKAKPEMLGVNYFLLVTLMILAATLGNAFGFWFGRKAGEKLYERKESLFFKKRHLEVTRNYYERYGGNLTLVMARFLPVVRTFAPVIAGVLKIDPIIFFIYNIIGATAWILSLTAIGYFLVQLFPGITNYMGYIFIALIVITSIPILRIAFQKKS
jgi:membrane-associated protein